MTPARKIMNKKQNPEAETVQTTNVPAVALARLVRHYVGDIVAVPIKNRWGVYCAATIKAVHAETSDATVWSLQDSLPEESFDPDHDSHDETTYQETP